MYPDAKIDFKPKESGTRAGIVVAVTCHDEVTTYYMKTYHHAGAGFSIPPYKTEKIHLSDLREMFVYRLLELLGVGPIVFFPLYFASTNIPFIATREVKEFKKMNQINDASLRNKVVVEVICNSNLFSSNKTHSRLTFSTLFLEYATCMKKTLVQPKTKPSS